MTLKKVISGGQTGADQGGLRAAQAAGIETGGWAPKGWLTEDGPAPWLAEFGMTECSMAGYPARTEANARDSDATLWFGSMDSPGYRATRHACLKRGRLFIAIHPDVALVGDIVDFLVKSNIETLNIAGNRESKSPGIGLRVEQFLTRVFEWMSSKTQEG